MYSTELRQWISGATHPTVLMVDGQAYIANKSCCQLLGLSESEPVMMRHLEAALPGFLVGFETGGENWPVMDRATGQNYQALKRAYWDTDLAEYSLVVVELVPLAWVGAPVGFNSGWLTKFEPSKNSSSFLMNLDTNSLSLSSSCAQRLGLIKPANLDSLLERLHPVDQGAFQQSLAIINNEPWRPVETLFVKLKAPNGDEFEPWQLHLRKAPPVHSGERWVAITLSSATSKAGLVQPARGKVGAGSMLVLQLMDFRDFVDSYGAENGVGLSEQLLSILTTLLTADDQAWRLSDDVIALWFPGDTRGKRSDEVWFSTLQRLENPLVFGEFSYRVRIRGGRARAVNPESRAEQLIERAMAGLVEARPGHIHQAGKKTDESHAKLKAKRQRQTQLLKDFDEGRYRMIYQPLTSVGNIKEAIGVEALSRSVSATGELFLGGDIVDAAQRLDFVREWTEWGLAQIQEDLAGWLKGRPERFVTFNVMPHLLKDDASVAWFIETLNQIPDSFRQRLAIEVTEQMMGTQLSVQGLAEVRKLGVEIYLDDFGAGESNLYRLVDLQPDAIKLDRFLIELMLDDQPKHDTLIKLISLARSISPRIIAEGIERPEQLELVKALGVDWVQGYLIGRQLVLPSQEIVGQI